MISCLPTKMRIQCLDHLQELWERQNYAYWDATFCMGTHEFYNAEVLPMHVFFLIGMCQNSVADRQIHAAGDHKPLSLPGHAYQQREV